MAVAQPSLFSGLKLTIKTTTPIKQYDVYILEFNPTKHYIIDICSYTDTSPLFQLVGDGRTMIISYRASPKEKDKNAYNVLCSFLQTMSIPVPQTGSDVSLPSTLVASQPRMTTNGFHTVEYTVVAKEPYELNRPLLFRTPTSTHRAIIKNTGLNYLVKIEGTRGESCIEIFVENPIESFSVLAQIYSEEDCSYECFMEKGATVDMLKASLQVCSLLFGVSQFELKDGSNIECDTTPIPRKRIKPLSLAHMTIIKYGQTWYEQNFQAYLKNPSDREAYRKGLAALNAPISMTFKEFYRLARFQVDQFPIFEPLFAASSTWLEFFQKIPKEKHCELLYWAPSFMDTLMGFDVQKPIWVIDLAKMVPTSLMIFTNSVSYRIRGGVRRVTRSRRRGTHKQKHVSFFSNQFGGNILRL
jgi:hypothetical protein